MNMVKANTILVLIILNDYINTKNFKTQNDKQSNPLYLTQDITNSMALFIFNSST